MTAPQMRKLVYDFAASLDAFVARSDGSIEGFLTEGEHATEYLARLQGYDTVVMGRKAYEWGYPLGLIPGKRAYPHMQHYIVSGSLPEGAWDEVQVVGGDVAARVQRLKQGEGSPIYLCGGGELAGFLLDHGLIDRLLIKLNPVVLGDGVRAFGRSSRQVDLKLVASKQYANGVALLDYDVLGTPR